jgi:hypothetical protein
LKNECIHLCPQLRGRLVAISEAAALRSPKCCSTTGTQAPDVHAVGFQVGTSR